jgi:hypothetical protein
MPLHCKRTSVNSLPRLGLMISAPSRMTFLVVVEMAIRDGLDDVAALGATEKDLALC